MASVGRVGIRNDTRVTLITLPWLTDPVDREVLITATKDVISTYKQVPGLELRYPNLNSTTIEDLVSNTVGGSNHWIGSTRVGGNSSTSVVDTNLKVWGTDNLFVVDAGVFPGMPVGNPTGSIMVMAEMAATKFLKAIDVN
ncbi:hypothetical protein OPQ81_006784 [Rhizoctonia solani]|nr:hypothetical protein OPQ81_006784 [Rhizoctonia solani]